MKIPPLIINGDVYAQMDADVTDYENASFQAVPIDVISCVDPETNVTENPREAREILVLRGTPAELASAAALPAFPLNAPQNISVPPPLLARIHFRHNTQNLDPDLEKVTRSQFKNNHSSMQLGAMRA